MEAPPVNSATPDIIRKVEEEKRQVAKEEEIRQLTQEEEIVL